MEQEEIKCCTGACDLINQACDMLSTCESPLIKGFVATLKGMCISINACCGEKCQPTNGEFVGEMPEATP